METIAVYWEPKIKTYGFQEARDQALLRIDFRAEQMALWGSRIDQMGELGLGFHLVLLHYSPDREFTMSLIFERQWEDRVLMHMRKAMPRNISDSVHIKSPVELMFFHGPHFADRYGIADSVFSTLAGGGIPVLAAACSGAAVYLVFPEKTAQKASALLAEAFEVPQAVGRKA